jgi:uncharacterized protein
MIGLSATTGRALGGTEHLAQSIGDILGTPIGSRIMRRDYGSMLFELIDQPMNGATRLLLFAATALALRRWEPRLRLLKVSLASPSAFGTASGEIELRIEGERTDLPAANRRVIFSTPIRRGGASPNLA